MTIYGNPQLVYQGTRSRNSTIGSPRQAMLDAVLFEPGAFEEQTTASRPERTGRAALMTTALGLPVRSEFRRNKKVGEAEWQVNYYRLTEY